jgi:tetratricopeptide (TPR) repeat protein
MEKWFDRRRVAILAGIVIALGVGVFFAQQISEKKEQDGKSALYKIQKTFEDEQKSLSEAEKSVGTPLDVDTRFSKTVSELNGMISAKSANARVLFEASLKLGTLYLDHLQSEKAIVALKASGDFAKSGLQKASAQYLLGIAYEQNQKFKDALDSFQSGLTQNSEGLKGELLLGAIRASLKLNDREKAKKYSDQINKDLKGSKALEAAEALLKEAK